VSLKARVTEAAAPLNAFGFRWDAETEILAGRVDLPEGDIGFTGSWELESHAGAVVTLETVSGVLCGIEIVVWPDVDEPARLLPPYDAAPGRVVLEPADKRAKGVIEIETPISASAKEDVVHLILAPARARTVRVATNVLADLDSAGHLTGLWLVDVPPYPQGG
jgi:hypothetical protein